MHRLALCLFAVVALPAVASAQWFPRLFGGKQTQVSSACPGGVCPTTAPQANYPAVGSMIAAPLKVASNRAGHWSYPGTIDSHLEGTHGVATGGMSRQQKLDLHDSLHEGTATRATYPSVASAVGYGSAGGFAVGNRNDEGFVITQIFPPKVASANAPAPESAPSGCLCNCPNCKCNQASPSNEPSEMRSVGAIGERRSNRNKFRNELIEAAQQAKNAGQITQLELELLSKKVRRNPFALQVLHEAVYDSAVADGMQSVGERDWIAFIEKLIPLIIKLIDLFS